MYVLYLAVSQDPNESLGSVVNTDDQAPCSLCGDYQIANVHASPCSPAHDSASVIQNETIKTPIIIATSAIVSFMFIFSTHT